MPLEIRPGDIVPRPAEVVGKAAAGGGFHLGDIKKYMSQFKELKQIAEEMGVDLSSIIPGIKGRAPAMPATPAPAPAQQLRNFIMLMQMRYGDITVNELVEKLRQDFGNCKISELKGGL